MPKDYCPWTSQPLQERINLRAYVQTKGISRKGAHKKLKQSIYKMSIYKIHAGTAKLSNYQTIDNSSPFLALRVYSGGGGVIYTCYVFSRVHLALVMTLESQLSNDMYGNGQCSPNHN